MSGPRSGKPFLFPVIVLTMAALGGCGSTNGRRTATAGSQASSPFPVEPELFLEAFPASEGITFNGEGKLFVGAQRAVWLVAPDGSTTKLVDVHTHLGQAGIGSRDILAADFGPTNVFRDGAAQVPGDGIVWRVSPEGHKEVAATGIDDPNFILVLADGSYLVSDDGTHNIYRVTPDGAVTLWSDAIPYPNGMALSADGSTLYVAQIFSGLDPVVPEDRLWALGLDGVEPDGDPELVFESGDDAGAFDGLAMDSRGHVYVADNGAGKIWRFDPVTRESILIAAGMPHVASLAFGEGDFDRQAIYATSTFKGGGRIWKVEVGEVGAALHR